MTTPGSRTKPLVLVFSATAGAGHVRAAEALVETARHESLPLTLRHFDILDFTLPLFKKVYSEFYFAVVRTSPDLWGYLYKKSEKGPKRKSPLVKLFDHFNYKKYLQTIEELRPDAILCTHFLPYLALSAKVQKSGYGVPMFSVPTDYDVHALWIQELVSKYYVATDEAAWTLTSNEIPEDKVMVTGIPVMPQFGERVERETARTELNLSPDAFTIMILSGGYGIGIIDELVASVAAFVSGTRLRRVQLIVVCGKNQALYDKLKRKRFSVSVKLFKYISFVDKLMDCADVLITKSGGLTVTEALAKHLPMIIFDPIPGQEGRNADYLAEHGAAVRASSFSSLHFKLKQMIEEPAILSSMGRKATQIARPGAARVILEDVVKICTSGGSLVN